MLAVCLRRPVRVGGWLLAQFPAPLNACGGPFLPVGGCCSASGRWVSRGRAGGYPSSVRRYVGQIRTANFRRPLRADTPRHVPFPPYASTRRRDRGSEASPLR
ncbi:hypothetical protein GCM10018783_45930 [Streptomyces griseosporeus]|nr:hypothetical protein GCM10018783_45930 [Streptomyces griseosporeus]